MNKFIFLILIIILALGLPLIFNFSSIIENFSNYSLDQVMGKVPDSQTKVLVQDTYPPIGKNEISNNNVSDIWFDYPIFKLGSYDQITNNIRYSKNPDIGICTPASMCGALYHDKIIGDNYVKPLPPVNSNYGTRVGYFTTNDQLIDSLPYRTNMQNILY
jgi:hypothetical protein